VKALLWDAEKRWEELLPLHGELRCARFCQAGRQKLLHAAIDRMAASEGSVLPRPKITAHEY